MQTTSPALHVATAHYIESLRLPFIAQMSNCCAIIRHVIHPRFTLPLLFFARVCTCRQVSRHLNLPQRFSHDSRLIYTFGKLILVKLVTSHCDLPFAVCTINGNLNLSIVWVCAALIPTIGKKYQHWQAILLSCPKDTREKVMKIIPSVTAHT